jgi:hypothetical protein
MPLAMANVLQLPILIFVPHNLVPFTTVFPRYNVDCMPPLSLAYRNDGPGHYDALIPSKHSPSDSSTNDGSKTVGETNDKTADISSDKNVNPNKNVKHNKNVKPRNYCRCGINKKRESMQKVKKARKYKVGVAVLFLFRSVPGIAGAMGRAGALHAKTTLQNVHDRHGNGE